MTERVQRNPYRTAAVYVVLGAAFIGAFRTIDNWGSKLQQQRRVDQQAEQQWERSIYQYDLNLARDGKASCWHLKQAVRYGQAHEGQSMTLSDGRKAVIFNKGDRRTLKTQFDEQYCF